MYLCLPGIDSSRKRGYLSSLYYKCPPVLSCTRDIGRQYRDTCYPYFLPLHPQAIYVFHPEHLSSRLSLPTHDRRRQEQSARRAFHPAGDFGRVFAARDALLGGVIVTRGELLAVVDFVFSCCPCSICDDDSSWALATHATLEAFFLFWNIALYVLRRAGPFRYHLAHLQSRAPCYTNTRLSDRCWCAATKEAGASSSRTASRPLGSSRTSSPRAPRHSTPAFQFPSSSVYVWMPSKEAAWGWGVVSHSL